MLLLDAIAPLIGAGLTLLSHVPDQDLLSYLDVRRLAASAALMITPTFRPRVAGSRHVAYPWTVALALEWV